MDGNVPKEICLLLRILSVIYCFCVSMDTHFWSPSIVKSFTYDYTHKQWLKAEFIVRRKVGNINLLESYIKVACHSYAYRLISASAHRRVQQAHHIISTVPQRCKYIIVFTILFPLEST